jgi:hypothetical protein
MFVINLKARSTIVSCMNRAIQSRFHSPDHLAPNPHVQAVMPRCAGVPTASLPLTTPHHDSPPAATARGVAGQSLCGTAAMVVFFWC